MRKAFCLIGILVFHCYTLFAQSKQFNGKVFDSKDGSPLSGVTVTAKGSKSSALSGPDGNFSIKVGSKSVALHFSYIGYEDMEVPLGSGTDPMLVSLKLSATGLNEVVVVGYGKAQKRDVTGSMTRIDAKEVENFPAPSFESAIQGKAAGVVVTSGSGKLGQAIQVNIRGTSSISASTQPLYVIDGLPVTSVSMSDRTNDPTNPLADINPNDIESLEVLKDASAAVIYGARAANGVVLITTKKGKNGHKTSIELNTNTGISNPARQRHFLNAKQYVGLMEQAAVNDGTYDFNNNISGFPSVDSAISYYKLGTYEPTLDQFALGTDWRNAAVNTNWQAQSLHKNAPSNQINLSASGGSDKTRFFISGFYNDQDAIVINNRFTRYGARFNIDHNATDKLVFGLNLAVDRSQLNKVTNDNSFSSPQELVAQIPISPLIDPGTGLPNNNTLYPNGIYDALYDFDHQTTYRTLGNGYADLTILPFLSFRSEVGVDLMSLNENEFEGKESFDGAGIGKAATISSQSSSLNTNNYFTFNRNLGDDHKLNAVVGMSYLQNDLFRSTASGQNYPSDAVRNFSGATNITAATSTDDRYTFLSYFMRANYSFRQKYLLSASVRTDGSSRFAPSHRYGWFPSVSAGWLLSEEDFLKGSNTFSLLKLRASYGQTGNSEIGESRFQSLFTVTNYPNLPGYTPTQLGSDNLRWEKTSQADVGLDYGLFKGRLSGELDYYHKHTTQLLLNTNIPASTGYFIFSTGSTTIYQNLGELTNQGVEGTVTSQNFTGTFKWSTTFNIGYNKNRVGNIGGQIVESSDQLQRAVDGQPLGTWYMQKFVGVDPANGDALYEDANGKPTNVYANAGRFSEGKYLPDVTAGLTNTFSYKGFDLSVFFYGVTGNKLYNSAGVYMSDGFANYNFDNQTTDLLRSWKKPGDITDIPRVGQVGLENGSFIPTGGSNSTRWLYSGKYLRLKNVSIGYNLPKVITDGLKISSARFYISGTNLFTWTKYPGDPEVNTNTVTSVGGGEDFYTIPQAKTFTFGLNVKF